MQHALLSASGSGTWLNCPGSRKAQQDYVDKTSPFAVEGSRAHELADICLKSGEDAAVHIGMEIMGEAVPYEMAQYVQEYLDYVRSHEGENTTLYTEERVDFSNVVPEGFGTMDAAVLDFDSGTCHIFDLKYGRGVQVYSYENTQSQLYALGLLNELGFLDAIKMFRIHIVQPRKVTPEPWNIKVEDLKIFAAYASERAELAMTDSAPRVPGDKQCMWCKAKPDCPALAKFSEETILAEFDTIEETTPVDKLSDEQKKSILDNKKLIEGFLKAVEQSVYERIENGEGFKGYKIVSGRSIRKWGADAEAYLKKKLKSKAYKKALIGIGDAEKLLGKGTFDDYTVRPTGKPTLAVESDKRPALLAEDISDEFEIEG